MSPRVTTDLWIAALMRRVFAGGGFAAVLRRGAAEAGAAFLVFRGPSGEAALYGPAPQTAYDERAYERCFAAVLQAPASSGAIEARLEREIRFDPDLWIVEIEASPSPPESWIPVTTP